MSDVTILVVEGNSPDLLSRDAEGRWQGAAEQYQDRLKVYAPAARFEIIRPHFPDFSLADVDFDRFDGFAFTGSGVAWSASDKAATPACQVMEKALATGRPVIGSCYGMQLGVAVLGGVVGPNPAEAELAIAPSIHLTDAGKAHALFAGKPPIFDALCMHRDDCLEVPSGMIRLAGNDHCAWQAGILDQGGVRFFGVQYHPELEFRHIAGYLRRSQVDQFSTPDSLARHAGLTALTASEAAADFDRLQADPHAADLTAKYKISESLTDRACHERELANWMKWVADHAKQTEAARP